jgi:hypothetical protein
MVVDMRGQGRPGGWVAQPQGGFASHRGQGIRGSEGQAMDNNNHDNRDYQLATRDNREH